MYTIPEAPNVDRLISKHLDTIVQSITTTWPDRVQSILLIGGFGRGEGSVIETLEGWRPYNDYDLLVITDRRIPRRSIQTLSQHLTELTGMNFIDIGVLPKRQLSTLAPSVFSFDLQASQVLYGDPDILVQAAIPQANTLHQREAVIQLHNRVICFFERTEPAFWIKGDVSLTTKREMALQLSKAVIAATIADLIMSTQYTSSYRAQREIAVKNNPNEQTTISTAYNLKLGQQNPDEIDLVKFWLAARAYFVHRYQHVVHNNLALDEHEQAALANSKLSLRQRLKGYTGKVLLGNALPTPRKTAGCELAARRLLESVGPKLAIIPKHYETAVALLNQIEPDRPAPKNWNDTISTLNDLWQRYHH